MSKILVDSEYVCPGMSRFRSQPFGQRLGKSAAALEFEDKKLDQTPKPKPKPKLQQKLVWLVFRTPFLQNYLVEFVDVATEYALSRALPVKLSLWRLPPEFLLAPQPCKSLENAVFTADRRDRTRAIAKLEELERHYIPLACVLPEVPIENPKRYSHFMLRRFCDSLVVDFCDNKIRGLYLLPSPRLAHNEFQKSRHFKFSPFVLADLAKTLNLSSVSNAWCSRFVELGEECYNHFRQVIVDNQESLVAYQQLTIPPESHGIVQDSFPFWLWKEFGFMCLNWWNYSHYPRFVKILDKFSSSIPPPEEMLWRRNEIAKCRELIHLKALQSQGGESEFSSSEHKLLAEQLADLPLYYKVATGLSVPTRLTPADIHDIAWLFDVQFFHPLKPFVRFGEWNYDKVTGRNHPVILTWFSNFWNYYPRPWDTEDPQLVSQKLSCAWQRNVRAWESLGVEINFREWDYDTKTGFNHEDVHRCWERSGDLPRLLELMKVCRVNPAQLSLSKVYFSSAEKLLTHFDLPRHTLFAILESLEDVIEAFRKHGQFCGPPSFDSSSACSFELSGDETKRTGVCIVSTHQHPPGTLTAESIRALAKRAVYLLSLVEDMASRFAEAVKIFENETALNCIALIAPPLFPRDRGERLREDAFADRGVAQTALDALIARDRDIFMACIPNLGENVESGEST